MNKMGPKARECIMYICIIDVSLYTELSIYLFYVEPIYVSLYLSSSMDLWIYVSMFYCINVLCIHLFVNYVYVYTVNANSDVQKVYCTPKLKKKTVDPKILETTNFDSEISSP